jgi:sulfite exporter TauE/SafE
MMAAMLGAFLTALVGSPHCAGMCGGFAAACSARRGGRGTLYYSLGRLATYASLGALAGTVGSALAELSWAGMIVSGVLLVFFAGRLAGILPPLRSPWPRATRPLARLVRSASAGSGLLLGAANALIPCGLVYATLALPIAVASPWQGAVIMTAFGIGTMPVMWAVGLGALRLAGAGKGLRIALAVAILTAGSLVLVLRAPRPSEAGEVVPACHAVPTAK